MKNVLIIRLREKDFKLKFSAIQHIYELLDKDTFPKKINDLISSSFDCLNIDN